MPFLARAHIRQVLCSQGRLLLVSRKRFLCAPASNMAVAVTDEEILKKIGNNPEENVATKEVFLTPWSLLLYIHEPCVCVYVCVCVAESGVEVVLVRKAGCHILHAQVWMTVVSPGGH